MHWGSTERFEYLTLPAATPWQVKGALRGLCSCTEGVSRAQGNCWAAFVKPQCVLQLSPCTQRIYFHFGRSAVTVTGLQACD